MPGRVRFPRELAHVGMTSILIAKKTKPSMKYSVAALFLTAGFAAQAQSVISWNLDNNGGVSGANQAGVILAANWNNSWPSNPTSNLIDNSGAATTLNLAYGSFNSWSIQGSHPGQDANGSYNRELLNGYLNSGPAAWGPSITNSYVTLTSIPYALYDVYIYFSSDTAGRIGSATDGATTCDFSTIGPAEISGANALLTQTTDTTGANPSADYAVFTGETASSLTLTVNALGGNDQWLGIAGFQVVAVPEPGTLALAGIGGIAVLFLRNRSKR